MKLTNTQLLNLLRGLFVDWMPVESGAPGINPYLHLFGNDVPTIIEGIIDCEDSFFDFLQETIGEFYVDFMGSATIKPGRYELHPDHYIYYGGEEIEKNLAELGLELDELKQLIDEQALLPGIELDHANQKAFFTLSEEHIHLLRIANHRDDTLGIDPKRPIFGTWVELGVALALGEQEECDDYSNVTFTDEQNERYMSLHEQLLPAMQVFFLHAEMNTQS